MRGCFMDGAQGRNRTTDTRIFSPLLYRLSYLGYFWATAFFKPKTDLLGN